MQKVWNTMRLRGIHKRFPLLPGVRIRVFSIAENQSKKAREKFCELSISVLIEK